MGLQFALDDGFFRVMLEAGYKELISLVQDGLPCMASNGFMVEDICSLSPLFQCLYVVFY